MSRGIRTSEYRWRISERSTYRSSFSLSGLLSLFAIWMPPSKEWLCSIVRACIAHSPNLGSTGHIEIYNGSSPIL